jgi:hypothetical protein
MKHGIFFKERKDWFSLPLSLRQKWWKETNFSKLSPSNDLEKEIYNYLETRKSIENKMNLKEAIADKIKNSTPHILDKVVEKVANETIEKRINHLHQAYTECDNIERELRKIKPDVKNYSVEDGKEHLSFSDNVWQEKKKKEERLAKLKKCIEEALNDHTKFNELGQVISQK